MCFERLACDGIENKRALVLSALSLIYSTLPLLGRPG